MPKKTQALSQFKPSSDNFAFRDFPFYWVARLGNLYSQTMESVLKKFGMNITVWRIGMILRENGAISVSEIATHAALRMSTITKAVYKMQDNGLVTVKPSEEDARVSIVSITPQGHKAITTVISATQKIFDNAFAGLAEKDLKHANTVLQHIFSNLSSH